MRAASSWGPEQPLIQVGPDNFLQAVFVEAKVEGCWKFSGRALVSCPLPPTSILYNSFSTSTAGSIVTSNTVQVLAEQQDHNACLASAQPYQALYALDPALSSILSAFGETRDDHATNGGAGML